MKLFEKTVGLIALFLICLHFSCSEDWRCYEPSRLDVALSQKEISVSGGQVTLSVVNPYCSVEKLIITVGKSTRYLGNGVFENYNHTSYEMTESKVKNKFIFKNPEIEGDIITAIVDKGRVEFDFPSNKTGESRTFVIFGKCNDETASFLTDIIQN